MLTEPDKGRHFTRFLGNTIKELKGFLTLCEIHKKLL